MPNEFGQRNARKYLTSEKMCELQACSLTHFETKLEIILATEAREYDIGTVLRMAENVSRPMHFLNQIKSIFIGVKSYKLRTM